MPQKDLDGNCKIKLTKAEESYLIFAEKQKIDEQKLDLLACKQMGLTKQEIKFLDLVFTAYKSFGTPAGSCDDNGLQYLIWELDHLPRCDPVTKKITLQSFLDSVGVGVAAAYGKDSSHVKKEDYFNCLKYTIKHAEERDVHDYFLLKIYKKIYKFCKAFEKVHKLKEKDFESSEKEPTSEERFNAFAWYKKEVDSVENVESIKSECKDIQKLEKVDENEPVGEKQLDLITEKQKAYLESDFLFFKLDGKPKQKKALMDNLDKLTKVQASATIQTLLRAPQSFDVLFKEIINSPNEAVVIPAAQVIPAC